MKKILSGLLFTCILAGCIGDEFDTNLLVDDVDTTVGLSIPLAKSTVSMADILSDQTDKVKYDGDRIILFQENDSMEYVGINDFFRLSASDVDVSIPFVVFNTQNTIEQNQAVEFSIPDASISVMELNYRVAARGNNLEVPLLLEITLETESGTDRVIQLEIRNNELAEQTFTGDRFALSDNTLNASVKIQPLYNGGFYGNSIGSLNLQFDELLLSYVKGTMGENQVTMDEGTYDLDFDVLEDIPGDIEFANPELSVIIDNGTPFKGLIATTFDGIYSGEKINLASQPFTMESNNATEPTVRTRFVLNNDNSNINSFIAKTPEQLIYAGLLTLNPNGEITEEVEMTDEDRIYVGYGIEVPLELKLNAELEDEVIELDDIDAIDDLAKATLVFASENGLPIAASASIKFYHAETQSVLETMDIEIINAAEVDAASGVVTKASSALIEIDLTESQLESLRNSDELHVSLRLNTTDYDKGQTVVFQKNDALQMQMAIRGKIEYNN
ncbi:hypothetical protein [Carboxylicivirga marina]|uniref:Uncharacterized protein n=1 Tax=Carboxylicivirga marina TaxID=2800988 RepID=A0ABS1HKG6_9BACT|nr:hypothetical protein [Carboxylicivirga marina]MBK3518155.1 hypothetical protein [Carboxylicivirga marina]